METKRVGVACWYQTKQNLSPKYMWKGHFLMLKAIFHNKRHYSYKYACIKWSNQFHEGKTIGNLKRQKIY